METSKKYQKQSEIWALSPYNAAISGRLCPLIKLNNTSTTLCRSAAWAARIKQGTPVRNRDTGPLALYCMRGVCCYYGESRSPARGRLWAVYEGEFLLKRKSGDILCGKGESLRWHVLCISMYNCKNRTCHSPCVEMIRPVFLRSAQLLNWFEVMRWHIIFSLPAICENSRSIIYPWANIRTLQCFYAACLRDNLMRPPRDTLSVWRAAPLTSDKFAI